MTTVWCKSDDEDWSYIGPNDNDDKQTLICQTKLSPEAVTTLHEKKILQVKIQQIIDLGDFTTIVAYILGIWVSEQNEVA